MTPIKIYYASLTRERDQTDWTNIFESNESNQSMNESNESNNEHYYYLHITFANRKIMRVRTSQCLTSSLHYNSNKSTAINRSPRKNWAERKNSTQYYSVVRQQSATVDKPSITVLLQSQYIFKSRIKNSTFNFQNPFRY